MCIYAYIHTHTHTYIYIYIYILVAWARRRFLDMEVDGSNPQLHQLVAFLRKTLIHIASVNSTD